MSRRRLVFLIIFIVGLSLCLLWNVIYGDFYELGSLVFSAVIALFGGAGMLMDIFAKD